MNNDDYTIKESIQKDFKDIKIFNRLKFIEQISKKYNMNTNKLFEILLDADISIKKLTKPINASGKTYFVTRKGIGPLITKYGNFYQTVFEVDDEWKNYTVISKSNLDKENMLPKFDENKDIFLRIDSGCSSGQIFGDLTCECKDQLNSAMEILGKKEQGAIIYIQNQDGRGKGIEFKLATLYLQKQLGVDTIESFTLLEKNNSTISLDSRSYGGSVAILKFLGATNRIVLSTNNTLKLNALELNDIKAKIESLSINPTKYTYHHLKAKEKSLGHNFNRREE